MQTSLTIQNLGAFILLESVLLYLFLTYVTKAKTLPFVNRVLGSLLLSFVFVSVATYLLLGKHPIIFSIDLDVLHNYLLQIFLTILSAIGGGLLLLESNKVEPELAKATLEYHAITNRFENLAFDAIEDNDWSDDALRAACRLSVGQIEDVLGNGSMYNIEHILNDSSKRIYTRCIVPEVYYVSLTVTVAPNSDPGYEKWDFVTIELRKKEPAGFETLETYSMEDILSDN